VADQLREVFGEEVYQTEIPRNVRLGEAPSFGKPVHAYDPLCRGAVAYTNLALEFLSRMNHQADGVDEADTDTQNVLKMEAS
jgi:chromosome partitioning protein